MQRQSEVKDQYRILFHPITPDHSYLLEYIEAISIPVLSYSQSDANDMVLFQVQVIIMH